MSRQAMQLALEALENASDIMDSWAQKRQDDAITALRAALAEPEQEPIGHADLGINNIRIFSEGEPRVIPEGRTPLYTAPPQRKWVGLTDEGMEELEVNSVDKKYGHLDVRALARAIEAKLKEKNT